MSSDSSTLVHPYLLFGGRCEAALEFYKTALGAEVELVMRYNESPEPTPPGMLAPGFENKVMHACFHVGGSTLMASDGCSEEDGNFDGFSLSLSLPTEADCQRVFGRSRRVAKCGWRSAKRFGRRVSAW